MGLILGIDDAGRGPLIGPMILAGVLVTKTQEEKIKKAGAKDSKLLPHTERISLSELIKENSISHKILETSAHEIDNSLSSGTNLNTLEALKSAEIINALNTKKDKIIVIVDCPSTNLLAWKNTLISFIEHKENLKIKCEHKADFNHPSVSAASILAKVKREEAVSVLKKQYGNIGSGYPSDPITIKFLKENGEKYKDSGIFRKSWSTWKKIFPEDSLQFQGNKFKQQKLF
ncbi:MAG: ribonuclease HII [Candidatus Pacearchaeota archaeon]|nr:ribonuclease HII [Candidatus Pacearchaeota archaeon]